ARVAPEERAVHHPASRQLGGEAAELVDTTNSDPHDAHAHAPLIAARLQPERLELRGLQLGFDRLHGERGSKQLACHRTRGWKTRKSGGASAAGCGASARTGGRDPLRGTEMPRRGRPAQGHAPAEGVAQYDMAHLFMADAERPNPGSGGDANGGRVAGQSGLGKDARVRAAGGDSPIETGQDNRVVL